MPILVIELVLSESPLHWSLPLIAHASSLAGIVGIVIISIVRNRQTRPPGMNAAALLTAAVLLSTLAVPRLTSSNFSFERSCELRISYVFEPLVN